MENIDVMLEKLNRSKFRNSFRLTKKMNDYIIDKGMDIIKSHTHDFLEKRLRVYNEATDGRQTPMKNHPVFIAQHATATCCRGCMEKWYHIPKTRDLTDEEIDYFQSLIMKWIDTKMKK